MFEFTPGYTQLSWTQGSVLPRFYYALNEAFFGFSALAALGVLALIALPPMHSRQREATLVLSGVIAMQLLGVVMQGKFFQYHYAATLPLIAVLGGLGLFQLWRRSTGLRWGPVAAALGAAVLLTLQSGVNDLSESFWQRSWDRMSFSLGLGDFESRKALNAELYQVADYNLDADRRVAEYLKNNSQAADRLFVWGFEPAIYWMSERTPASRFIYNVAQRAPWESEHARGLLMRDLETSPPDWIVVQHNDVFFVVTGDSLDSRAVLATFAELDAVLGQFERVTRIEDFDLYRRSAAAVTDAHPSLSLGR